MAEKCVRLSMDTEMLIQDFIGLKTTANNGNIMLFNQGN